MKKLSLFLFCLTLASCSSFKKPEPAHYAVAAYQKQESEKEQHLDGPVNEATRKDFIVEIAEGKRLDWEPFPYETIEGWFERHLRQVERNANLISDLEVQLVQMESQQANLGEQIHIFLTENEKLRNQIHQKALEVSEEVFADKISTPPPPFKIHLVRKGDTLTSIALQYYNDETKIVDIMRWNRGWVRHSEELIAGVSLVLFPPGTLNQSQEIVDNFMDKITD